MQHLAHPLQLYLYFVLVGVEEKECADWLDCILEGGQCQDLDQLGVSCLCKNGQCKVSADCGSSGFTQSFRTCSSCTKEDCQDEGVCVWSQGKCGNNIFMKKHKMIFSPRDE